MNKYDYKETLNINNQLVKEFKTIQGVCSYISKNKHSIINLISIYGKEN